MRVVHNDNLLTLREMDVYSMSLFILYKLTQIPEYSITSELPYVLKKEDLFNFCNLFGGQTIRVPTLDELFSVMNLVLLYQYVEIDKIPYDDAISQIGFKSSELRNVKVAYNKMREVLKDYKFDRH